MLMLYMTPARDPKQSFFANQFEKSSILESHLGAIWELFGEAEAEEASGRHLEVRSQKVIHLSAKMHKFLFFVYFTKRF